MVCIAHLCCGDGLKEDIYIMRHEQHAYGLSAFNHRGCYIKGFRAEFITDVDITYIDSPYTVVVCRPPPLLISVIVMSGFCCGSDNSTSFISNHYNIMHPLLTTSHK